MKILFLDIDGVLTNTKIADLMGGFPTDFSTESIQRFDWGAIRCIRELCWYTDAKIVLSSSWRRHFPASEVAENLGLDIIDATPTTTTRVNNCRGDEIQDWLDANPEVTQWAIVDDDADMLPEQFDRFVQTNMDHGLTMADVARLQDLLIKE